MLTRRGRMLVAGSLLLLGGGRLLGMVELYMLAAGALALVAAAVAQVRLGGVELDARRELRPPRVQAGTAGRVELAVTNRGSRRSPVVAVRDPFDGGRRAASFLLAPLAPGETARAAYRLPTERRGVFDLGPLELRRSDAFGLAEAPREAAPATSLVVLPRIDAIRAPALTRGHDPLAGAEHPTAPATAGEDYAGLREYEPGDDLRRVHWRATARLDRLMVRQDQLAWQGRATVVLDLRRAAHSPASLEVAVSAAASLVSACTGRRSLVRLVAAGLDSGFGSGPTHLEAILEQLALVGARPEADLRPLLGPLHRAGNGGALAVVTTAAATAADLGAVAALRSRFGAVTVVLLDRSVIGRDGAGEPPTVAGLGPVVRVTADRPFAAAWAEARAGAEGRAGAEPRAGRAR